MLFLLIVCEYSDNGISFYKAIDQIEKIEGVVVGDSYFNSNDKLETEVRFRSTKTIQKQEIAMILNEERIKIKRWTMVK